VTPPSSPTTAKTRRYSSTRRARQAAQTRADVLLAAIRLFGRSGWTGTTLAAIAAEAGVAVETIYASFTSKKELLRAAMDMAIVGDAQPVPLIQREEFQQLRQLPAAQRLPAGLHLVGELFDGGHVTAVWSAMLEAAASDQEVTRWCAELENGRRETLSEFLHIVLDGNVTEPMLDVLWVLISPDAYTRLTTRRGWSRSRWVETMTEVIRQLVTSSHDSRSGER
jgi:AcrR family transcriptional regulator